MKTMMKRMLLLCLIFFTGVGVLFAAGTKKRKPLPYDFGSVTISNFSQQAGMPPVVFDHWVHRKSYTCRLCHVDIGFGMTANSTKIRAADNGKGYFCGTCHNGSTASSNKKKIFASCASTYTRDDYKRCVRCHALEKDPAKVEAFHRLAETLPRETLGNGIDWEKAEETGLIKPVDHLEGISLKSGMKVQGDFALKAKMEGMPDIIFSHSKHTVWNGCELCHPDIFVGIKRGSTKYTMIELFDGKYCGVCHDKVAFPQTDCKRCHAKQVAG